MKLGQLRASIRAAKGVLPTIEVALYPGAPVIPFALQKASLLEELEKAFPGGKATETGLTFDEKTGMLSSEFGASTAPAPVAVIRSDLDPVVVGQIEDAMKNVTGMVIAPETDLTFDLLPTPTLGLLTIEPADDDLLV